MQMHGFLKSKTPVDQDFADFLAVFLTAFLAAGLTTFLATFLAAGFLPAGGDNFLPAS
jgi:hypothetical protein